MWRPSKSSATWRATTPACAPRSAHLSAIHPRAAAWRVRGRIWLSSQARLRFTACHYSLVTTPPEKLTYLQRIPHIDSVASKELAFIHYLFKADLGGTAFYRHRKTGFEYVDQDRKPEYLRCLEEEKLGPRQPAGRIHQRRYTALRADGQSAGRFQPLVMYRRNSLHSGAFAPRLRCRPESTHRAPLNQRLFGMNSARLLGVSPVWMLHSGAQSCCFFSDRPVSEVGQESRPVSPYVP